MRSIHPTTAEAASSSEDAKEKDTEPPMHPDERQIRLDTDRSFVLYPAGDLPRVLGEQIVALNSV